MYSERAARATGASAPQKHRRESMTRLDTAWASLLTVRFGRAMAGFRYMRFISAHRQVWARHGRLQVHAVHICALAPLLRHLELPVASLQAVRACARGASQGGGVMTAGVQEARLMPDECT